MKGILIAVGALLLAPPAFPSDQAHWEYSGAAGPERWAELAPEYGACAAGREQSPVDLSAAADVALTPLAFDYTTAGAAILNTGHTVQVDMHAGSGITIDGVAFALKQFHFHAPSEHQLQGRSFPMEAHLVHADRDGHLAVAAVMVVEGAANRTLAQAWMQMPRQAGDRILLAASVQVANLPVFSVSPTGLLPVNRDHYRYTGSLTTPPCSEGVRWLVMQHPISASKAQIAAFTAVVGHPNNRPLQPLLGRDVLE